MESLRENYVVTIPEWKKEQNGKKHYVSYKLLIKCGGESWSSTVRYSSFRALHEAISKKHPNAKLPKLPAKKAFGNEKTEFVEIRRQQLEKYLQDLVNCSEQVRKSEDLSSILGFDSRVDYSSALHRTLHSSTSPRGPQMLGNISITPIATLDKKPDSSPTIPQPNPATAGSPSTPTTSVENKTTETTSPENLPTLKPEQTLAKSLYEFVPDDSSDSGQLYLGVGDYVVVEKQTDPTVSGEWSYGKNVKTGSSGYFPTNYIEIITHPESSNTAQPTPTPNSNAAPAATPTPTTSEEGAGVQDESFPARVKPTPPSIHRPKPPESKNSNSSIYPSGNNNNNAAEGGDHKPPPVPLKGGRGGPLASRFKNTGSSSPNLPTGPGSEPDRKQAVSARVANFGVSLLPTQGIETLRSATAGRGTKKTDSGDNQTEIQRSPSTGGSFRMKREADKDADSSINRSATLGAPAQNKEAPPIAIPNTGDRRTNIVNEILLTEKSYVEGLRLLVEEYKSGLTTLATSRETQQKGMGGEVDITMEQVRIIFSNIEVVQKLNIGLYAELTQRVAAWNNETSLIGDIFVKWAPFFKTYKTYGDNFAASTALCSDIRDRGRESVEAILDAAKIKSNNLTLDSLLITPIQRLPRYVLLLTDLLNNTKPDHPDYSHIQEAVNKVKLVADDINDSIRQSESRSKFADIALRGPQFKKLVLPHRKLIKEQLLMEKEKKQQILGKGNKSLIRIYLFSDIMVFSREKSNTYMFVVPVNLIWFSEDRDNAQDTSFDITTPERKFTFDTDSKEDKEMWRSIITTQVKAANSESDGEDREGVYQYANGNEYMGSWKNGDKHGHGHKRYVSGITYTGDWSRGVRCGHGTQIWPTGEKYEGDFATDTMSGRGHINYDSVTRYDGEFLLGKKHGSGVMTFPNGDVYDGRWESDCALGRGKMIYANGAKYDGFWREDKKHGFGMMQYVDGAKYEGGWVNGREDGKGRYEGGGIVYDGNWKDGKRHGNGKVTKEGKEVYNGDWVNGKREGRGIGEVGSGGVYEGSWKDDKREGKGKMTWGNNGGVYDGSWKDDKREGKGVMVWGNGNRYEGEWKDDKMNGHGVWAVKGEMMSLEGKWTNGAREGKMVCQYRKMVAIGDNYNNEEEGEMISYTGLMKGQLSIGGSNQEQELQLPPPYPSFNLF
eukprot:TRINITY_DN3510_c0_g6_i1.p1 TRINITY_DN3510_c0_g6~~TRINITY_DN3510_c0_g6_i1.p1  ORF type:complete len:1174 (+),score=355.40 TRINITY_DN3510_c0_g6_i1:92-3613(+)